MTLFSKKNIIKSFCLAVVMFAMFGAFSVPAEAHTTAAFLPVNASGGGGVYKSPTVKESSLSCAANAMSLLPENLMQRFQADGLEVYLISKNDEVLTCQNKYVWGMFHPGIASVKQLAVASGNTNFLTIDVETEGSDKWGGEVLLHELGHAVDSNVYVHTGKYVRASDTAEFQALYAKYASTIAGYNSLAAANAYSASEFFATSFAIAEKNGQWMASKCPDLYNYIQNSINQYIYA